MELEYTRLVSLLETISLIQPGDTFSTTTGEIINHNTWGSSFWRRYNGENRADSIKYIENIFQSAIKYLNTNFDASIAELLGKSLLSFSNLKITYNTDYYIKADINKIIANIDQELQQLKFNASNQYGSGDYNDNSSSYNDNSSNDNSNCNSFENNLENGFINDNASYQPSYVANVPKNIDSDQPIVEHCTTDKMSNISLMTYDEQVTTSDVPSFLDSNVPMTHTSQNMTTDTNIQQCAPMNCMLDDFDPNSSIAADMDITKQQHIFDLIANSTNHGLYTLKKSNSCGCSCVIDNGDHQQHILAAPSTYNVGSLGVDNILDIINNNRYHVDMSQNNESTITVTDHRSQEIIEHNEQETINNAQEATNNNAQEAINNNAQEVTNNNAQEAPNNNAQESTNNDKQQDSINPISAIILDATSEVKNRIMDDEYLAHTGRGIYGGPDVLLESYIFFKNRFDNAANDDQSIFSCSPGTTNRYAWDLYKHAMQKKDNYIANNQSSSSGSSNSSSSSGSSNSSSPSDSSSSSGSSNSASSSGSSSNQPTNQNVNESDNQPINQIHNINQTHHRPINIPINQVHHHINQRYIVPPFQNNNMQRPLNNPLHNPLNNPLNNPLHNPLNNPLHNPLNNPLHNPLNNPLHNPLNNPRNIPLNNPYNNPINNIPNNPLNQPHVDQYAARSVIRNYEVNHHRISQQTRFNPTTPFCCDYEDNNDYDTPSENSDTETSESDYSFDDDDEHHFGTSPILFKFIKWFRQNINTREQLPEP